MFELSDGVRKRREGRYSSTLYRILKYSEVSPPTPGWESDPIEAICLL